MLVQFDNAEFKIVYLDFVYCVKAACSTILQADTVCSMSPSIGCTVEPLLYDHPQNHIGVVV